jgi:hypothetical protein
VTTGYCLATLEPEKSCEVKPFQVVDDVDDFLDRLKGIQPRYIVMEDFEYRNRARAGLNLFPVQLIGIARLYEMRAQHQVGLTLQKAAQGKSYYKDETLKRLGLYKRGVPHGLDAMRHVLHWLTFGAGYQFNSKGPIEEFIKVV